mmetsp:Transcript_133290/g.371578  ORF Transcript_133290/g.371578 Transcript_133290/m.371578 type:complete len:93 (-) Transcript_133290:216-494(-)
MAFLFFNATGRFARNISRGLRSRLLQAIVWWTPKHIHRTVRKTVQQRTPIGAQRCAPPPAWREHPMPPRYRMRRHTKAAPEEALGALLAWIA